MCKKSLERWVSTVVPGIFIHDVLKMEKIEDDWFLVSKFVNIGCENKVEKTFCIIKEKEKCSKREDLFYYIHISNMTILGQNGMKGKGP